MDSNMQSLIPMGQKKKRTPFRNSEREKGL